MIAFSFLEGKPSSCRNRKLEYILATYIYKGQHPLNVDLKHELVQVAEHK